MDVLRVEIARLELGPDDALVVWPSDWPTAEQAREIGESVREWVPSGKVLVFQTGTELAVLTARQRAELRAALDELDGEAA